MSGIEELLSVELAGRDWAELARGAVRHDDAEPEFLRELLRFQLAGAPYAVAVERVREIVRMKEITPVPRVPAAVLGVVELRGEIVQVVDLRMRLGLPLGEMTRRSRIVVLHGDDDCVSGVLVDAVDEVLRASEASVSPSTGASGFVVELCERSGEFVSIIDIDRALELDDA